MSVRRQKSGLYRVDWRDGGGQRHRRGKFSTKHEAQKFEREMHDQAQLGVVFGKKASTLAEFLDEWERTAGPSLRTNTLAGYDKVIRARIKPVFGDVPLRLIDQRLAQDWVNEMVAEELAPRTVEFYFSVLSIILKMAAEYNLCKPLRRAGRGGGGVRLPKKVKQRRRIPTPAETMLLADTIQAPYRGCVLVAGLCGLRQSEVFGLHPTLSFDWERHKIRVWRSVEHKGNRVVDLTKNGHDREVTMPDVVEEALLEQMRERPHPDFVFHRNGKHLEASNFHHYVWAPARVLTGLEDVWFHSLRHSAASVMIAAGWSAKRVQLELGHYSAAFTLDQYGHLFTEDDSPARAGLNSALQAAIRSAPAESRTRMPLRAADFEPAASTSSATGADEEAIA